MSMTSGISLAPLMVDIKADIKGFKNDMSKAAVAGVSEAQKISKELSNTMKVGEGFSKVGGNLTKFVSVPLAGVGIAAGKMAVDFESNFAKVSTLLDSNVVDFDDYKSSLLKASNDSKVAVGEFSDAVYESISAGVDQTKAIGFTTEAMKLAKGGFTSGAKAVDVMTTAINGYKLKTEDANRISDLLITTQNLGKTTVDELASSMGSVIPIASAANYSIDELSAAYALMTKNGIATSEAGTYVKSMLSELTKSGSITDKALRELSGNGFAELKAEGKDTSEIFAMLNKHAKDNNITLKDMFGSVEAGSAAMVLASGDGVEYNEMLKAMEGSAGATQAAFEKIDISPAEQMKGALNKVKNAGIELGIALVPAITKVADVISELADKFSNLTEEQQSNILKWGAIAIAAGPVISMIGTGIKTFVGLKTVVGGVSAALGVFGTSAGVAATATTGVTTATATAAGATGLGAMAAGLGGVVAAVAPFALGAAAIGAAGYGVYKVMTTEVVPSVDLFADAMVASGTKMTEYGEVVNYETVKISEATKTAVGAYIDMDSGVKSALDSLYINSTTITEETCNNLMTSYAKMGTTITTGLEADKKNDLDIFVADSTALSELEKQKILETTNEQYAIKEEVITDKTNGIKQILERASEANRKLSKEEMTSINEIQHEMKTQAIKTLSENEVEAKAILERMAASDKRVTAEQAGEHIKTLNASRDEAIRIANEEYDGTIKAIIRMRDESGTITADQATKLIEEATRQKDGIVGKAEETREEALAKMLELNSGLEKEVDASTGKIKGFWSSLFSKWDSWIPKKKTFEYTTTARPEQGSDGMDGSHYNGLSYVPFDGYVARLHKGERVLTAEENKSGVQRGTTKGGDTYIFNSPKQIDEVEASRLIRRTNRELSVVGV
ncbi:MAG: phage tail tape measure protein, partial [Clostridium sp.]